MKLSEAQIRTIQHLPPFSTGPMSVYATEGHTVALKTLTKLGIVKVHRPKRPKEVGPNTYVLEPTLVIAFSSDRTPEV